MQRFNQNMGPEGAEGDAGLSELCACTRPSKIKICKPKQVGKLGFKRPKNKQFLMEIRSAGTPDTNCARGHCCRGHGVGLLWRNTLFFSNCH